MFTKLADVEKRFESLDQRLSDPALAGKPQEFRALSKERSDMALLVEAYRRYKLVSAEYDSNKALLEDKDVEMRAMAKDELLRLTGEKQQLENELKLLLLPKDPADDKNIMLEVRAGTGGDEAALFVGELFRMYERYAQTQGWRVEIMTASGAGIGGFKEIIAMVTGTKVYSKLKYEGGVHRVQRVPKTETQGRIHTSTVTVAVLPEAEEVDVTINPSDLKVETFRAGGPGGQSVNTTDSAVRITHVPTGVTVSCQDEKSQHKNKDKAMKILRARMYEAEHLKAEKLLSDQRKSMVGTGDRSERIRTYNFPQSRLTDHRIGLTLHQLPDVMEGKVGDVIDSLIAHFQAEQLKQESLI
ncbi:MAG: peptide chain release factor 1 [Deltaproteobacteria bacterium]|nr:peptide chain release factor 1 [Deltaproteobacteria bacterium]